VVDQAAEQPIQVVFLLRQQRGGGRLVAAPKGQQAAVEFVEIAEARVA
jgi:hypothetical protein